MNNLKLWCSVCLIIGTLCFACNQNDDDQVEECGPTVLPPNYFPLATGNYWFFDVYQIDTTGADVEYKGRDTIQIVGDTLIDGNTYAIVQESPFLSSEPLFEYYLRDSSGFLVTNEGSVKFTSSIFNTVVYTFEYAPTITGEFQTLETPVLLELPVGDFEALNYQQTVGHIENVGVTRMYDNYYSDGIGPVQQSFGYFIGNINFERRLIEYNLE